MSDFLQERLAHSVMIFDGGIGTEIYRRNFFINVSFENLCLSAPKDILAIHSSYVEAGVDVLTSNTFGANTNKLARFGLIDQADAINAAGVRLVKEAAGSADRKIMIAGSVGPVGEINRDANLSQDKLIAILERHVLSLEKAGADFILFESLSSLQDARFAALAAQKLAIPFVLSFTLDHLAQTTACKEQFPLVLLAFSSLNRQPSALGLNCGMGPGSTLSALEKVVKTTALPWIVQPNVGAPKLVDNRTMYMTTPEYFTTYAMRYMNLGARGIGGCCGITPAHIADMARSIRPVAKSEQHIPVQVVIPQVERMKPVPAEEKSSIGAKLARGEWVKFVEMAPPRGIDLSGTVAKAIQCCEAGFDAVNIPDGPRASSRISPIVTAIELQEKAKIETVLHCCGRDRNLIGLQADLLGCSAKSINNILFITGDPPKLGDYPFSSGVFDADSIGMAKIASRLNCGVDLGGKALGAQTRILIGVGADPNAIDQEREIRRLREKIEAGAEFIITQPIFDAAPLFRMLEKIADYRIPVIAGIWPLASYRNAEFMRNEVPGVVVPDAVMQKMADAGADKAAQRKAGIEIARSALASIRDRVQGVATSAPFGNVETAIEVACR